MNRGIRIGYSRESGRALRYGGTGHMFLCAPTRSGKGRDVLIPALLDWPFSCIVVDPKGELACVTSTWRKRFGQVRFLDPYGVVGSLTKCAVPSRYNPMARLDPRSIEFSARSEKISDGLIWEEGEAYSFFTSGARGMCSMIQMGLVEHGAPHERNLSSMRSVITGDFQNGVDVFGFSRAIMENSTNQALRQMAARFCVPGAMNSRSVADIIQTADDQTRFLSDPALAQSFSASDISFATMKERVVTTYVVLPIDFLDVCGKYFRLIIASALSELLSGPRGIPVLILMDEFYQLGFLKAIQNAMSMAAGFGVQLWPVLQDLNQLSGLYKDSWETFLSNAAVRIFFGPRDEKTSLFLSNQCGQGERRIISKSISYQDEGEQHSQFRQGSRFQRNVSRPPSINVNFSSAPRQLLLPHEARELDDDDMLLFVEGVKGPIWAKRRPYWREPDFWGKYSTNPYFG